MLDQLWFSITIKNTVWMVWPALSADGMDVLAAVAAVVGSGASVAMLVDVAGTGVLVGVASSSEPVVGVLVATVAARAMDGARVSGATSVASSVAAISRMVAPVSAPLTLLIFMSS